MIDQKIQFAIDKIKMLKAEKEELQKRIANLEEIIKTKNQEIENLQSEREIIKKQIEELLKELDLESNV
jgi:FtsZ-binding cell division protein ZapB